MKHKTYVIPNLHPSAVIRNRKQWEPLFIHALETAKDLLGINSFNQDKNSIKTTLINDRNDIINVETHNFKQILETLKNLSYKLVDVQRYKDFMGDQIVDQGIFAIMKDDKGNKKYLMLNDLKFHYRYITKSQSPEPLLPIDQTKEEYGPTCKQIILDRYGSLKQDYNKVYYNWDFSIDDWLVYQIKDIIPDSPTYTVAFFDIEVHSEDNVFPSEREANHPISTLSLLVDDKFYQIINTSLIKQIDQSKVADYIQQNGIEPFEIQYIYAKDDYSLLDKFSEILHKHKVDVLTAWNIYFDINYIANRCKRVGFDTTKFSPISKPMFPSGKLGYHFIPGIIVVDLLELYKSYAKREISYSLDYITKKNLGVSKVKYEGSLSQLLHNDPNLYIAYSAVDTKLLQKLEEKTGNLSLHLMLKDLSHTSFLNSFSTLSQIDGLMWQYAKKQGLALRQKAKTKDDEEKGTFIGAFVREPRKGYIPYVIDLDASSMYPSIMISLNISPETFVGYITDQDTNFMEKMLLTNEVDDAMITIVTNPNKEGFTNRQTVSIKVRDFKEKLYKSDLTISFSGAIFDKSKKGFITYILEDLIKRRKQYKKQALELLQSDNDKDKSLGQKYNVIQLALKVLANAIYGAMGNKAYRFYDTRISATITLTGQYEIKFVSGISEQYVSLLAHNKVKNHKEFDVKLDRKVLRQAEGQQHYVFYSDTDSSFIDIFDALSHKLSELLLNYKDCNTLYVNDKAFKTGDLDSLLRCASSIAKTAKSLGKQVIYDDVPLDDIVVDMFGETLEDISIFEDTDKVKLKLQ